MENKTQNLLLIGITSILVCGGLLVAAIQLGAYLYYTLPPQIAEQTTQPPSTPTPIPPDPTLINYQLEQARIQYEAGNYQQTITILDTLLEQNPNHGPAWILHGRTQLRLKDNQQALNDFSKAVGANENDLDARSYRAFSYLQAQLYEDALKDIEFILQKDPNNAKAWKMRGDCMFFMGKTPNAIQDAQHACDLGNEDGCTAAQRFSGK